MKEDRSDDILGGLKDAKLTNVRRSELADPVTAVDCEFARTAMLEFGESPPKLMRPSISFAAEKTDDAHPRLTLRSVEIRCPRPPPSG
jgi:hypothetical protein